MYHYRTWSNEKEKWTVMGQTGKKGRQRPQNPLSLPSCTEVNVSNYMSNRNSKRESQLFSVNKLIEKESRWQHMSVWTFL